MPRNETGRPIIHRAFGQIIQPGQWYEGRDVDENGEYLSDSEQQAASAKGAGTIAKLDPTAWPTREALDSEFTAPKLKEWAAAQELEFPASITKGALLDLIDAHRSKPEGGGSGQ